MALIVHHPQQTTPTTFESQQPSDSTTTYLNAIRYNRFPRMNSKLPAKRPNGNYSKEGKKRVCTTETDAGEEERVQDSTLMEQDEPSFEREVDTVTYTLKELAVADLEKGKTYQIGMNNQLLVAARHLNGVTPTGKLLSKELKEGLKPFMRLGPLNTESHLTITRSEFKGIVSFEEKYDRSIVSASEENIAESNDQTNSFTNVGAEGSDEFSSAFNTMSLIEDDQVPEKDKVPPFLMNKSATFNIPLTNDHIKNQIDNSAHERRKHGTRESLWKSDPVRNDLLLRYVSETSKERVNKATLLNFFNKHAPQYVKEFDAIYGVLNQWKQKKMHGLCSLSEDEDLTDGERYFFQHGHQFMKKFYGIEDDDQWEAIRIAILDCIILNIDLLQDTSNVAKNLKKFHRNGGETTLETFRRVVFGKRPIIRERLFSEGKEFALNDEQKKNIKNCKLHCFIKMGFLGSGGKNVAWTKDFLEAARKHFTADMNMK